ncbi:MAG: NUDIX domain-containing protein, partial [Hungatella sp.]
EHEVREQLGADHILGIWPLPSAKHIFSHIEWHMTGYLVQIEAKTSAYLMVDKIELAEIYPLPNAFQVYTKYILGQS